MKKIPVESTLAGAYRFLFTRIVTVIGTVWFPFLLLAAIGAGLVYLVVPHAWLAGHLPAFDPEHFNPRQIDWATFIRLEHADWAFGIVACIVSAMVTVGLMRSALGLKKTATLVYFSLGAPVWRLLAAYILGVLALIVLGLVLAAAVILVAVGLSHIPHLAGGYVHAGQAVLIAAAVLYAIYAAFRLFFFLPAVVVAEERIGLCRSWKLGKGNFWRIFLVILLIVIPIWIVGAIALGLTGWPVVFGEAMKLAGSIKPGVPPHPEMIFGLFHALLPVLPVYLAIVTVLKIVSLGLMTGAGGSAYNAVTASAVPPAPEVVLATAPEPAPAPEPEAAVVPAPEPEAAIVPAPEPEAEGVPAASAPEATQPEAMPEEKKDTE